MANKSKRFNVCIDYIEEVLDLCKTNKENSEFFKLLKLNGKNEKNCRKKIISNLKLIKNNYRFDNFNNKIKNDNEIRNLYKGYFVNGNKYDDPFIFLGNKFRDALMHNEKFSEDNFGVKVTCLFILVWIRANFDIGDKLLKNEKELLKLLYFNNNSEEKKIKDLIDKEKISYQKLADSRKVIFDQVNKVDNVNGDYKTCKIYHLYSYISKNKVEIKVSILFSLFPNYIYKINNRNKVTILEQYDQKVFKAYSAVFFKLNKIYKNKEESKSVCLCYRLHSARL